MSSSGDAAETPGKLLAVVGEGLYLINLLLPLLPLLGLVWLYLHQQDHEARLVRVNLLQALVGAGISTSLFIAANILILFTWWLPVFARTDHF